MRLQQQQRPNEVAHAAEQVRESGTTPIRNIWDLLDTIRSTARTQTRHTLYMQGEGSLRLQRRTSTVTYLTYLLNRLRNNRNSGRLLKFLPAPSRRRRLLSSPVTVHAKSSATVDLCRIYLVLTLFGCHAYVLRIAVPASCIDICREDCGVQL